MPNVGPLELAIVLIIALIVFGPKRLPELGRSLGRGIREFRGSVSGDDHDEDSKPHAGEIEPSEPSEPSKPSKPSAEQSAEDETVVHDRH
jgi:sec-independent protein translocase protein TatA